MIHYKHIFLAFTRLILCAICLSVGFFYCIFFLFAIMFLVVYYLIDKKYLRCPHCASFTNLDRLFYARKHIYHCHNCGKRIEIKEVWRKV